MRAQIQAQVAVHFSAKPPTAIKNNSVIQTQKSALKN